MRDGKPWFEPPPGGPASQCRPAIAYRAKVRAAAARWCDDRRPDPAAPDDYELACLVCEACQACELIARGEA